MGVPSPKDLYARGMAAGRSTVWLRVLSHDSGIAGDSCVQIEITMYVTKSKVAVPYQAKCFFKRLISSAPLNYF
jgi:hypothetical protein